MRSRIRAISHGIPRHLKRDGPIISHQTPGEDLQPLRRTSRHGPAKRKFAVLDDRRPHRKSKCTSNPTDLPAASFDSHTKDRRSSGATTPTDPRSKRNRTSRRAATEKPGLRQRPSRKPACPTCVLPQSPCPGQPEPTPDQTRPASPTPFSCPEEQSRESRSPSRGCDSAARGPRLAEAARFSASTGTAANAERGARLQGMINPQQRVIRRSRRAWRLTERILAARRLRPAGGGVRRLRRVRGGCGHTSGSSSNLRSRSTRVSRAACARMGCGTGPTQQ